MSNEWKKDREACDRASEGPWERRNLGINEPAHRASPGSIARAQSVEDARFIARARTRWPAALDEIERLRKENERLSEWGEALSQALSDTAAELADAKRRLGEGTGDLLAAVEEAKRGLAYYQDSHKPGPPEPPRARDD